MKIDLGKVATWAGAETLVSPLPRLAAQEGLCALLREAAITPPISADWEKWRQSYGDLFDEQLGMLVWLLGCEAIREPTRVALRSARTRRLPRGRIQRFFSRLGPITGEMVRANALRREEFVRKWAREMGIGIASETPDESQARVDALDYRVAARKLKRAEAAARKAAVKQASPAAQPTWPRGWRE